MTTLIIIASCYVVGFLITTAAVFFTGGECHVRKGEGKWILVNLAIWPFWWVLILYAVTLRRALKDKP